MAMRYYISTEEASFFNNNIMGFGDSIPTTGTHRVGDFIISSKQNDGIFGWVCIVAGTPGEWDVIGSGNGTTSEYLSPTVMAYINSVEFDEPRTRVEIGIEEYDKLKDILEVHYNGLMLAEGVHYNISEDGSYIEAIDEIWNESADDIQQMIFRVLKSEGVHIKELTNTINIDSACFEVEMGIDEYSTKKDVIEVHLNGVLLVAGLDYEILDGKIIKLDTTEAWNPYNVEGQKMHIRVIRNIVSLIDPCDGSVTMEKLADDVKQAIIDASKIDLSPYAEKADIGSTEQLETEEKTIVGAINELFQNANNGKELIASAIGEPLTSEDTFQAMSDKINTMKNDLKTVLVDEGVEVVDEDSVDSLITKVDNKFTDIKQLLVDRAISKGISASLDEDYTTLLNKTTTLTMVAGTSGNYLMTYFNKSICIVNVGTGSCTGTMEFDDTKFYIKSLSLTFTGDNTAVNARYTIQHKRNGVVLSTIASGESGDNGAFTQTYTIEDIKNGDEFVLSAYGTGSYWNVGRYFYIRGTAILSI